MKRKSLWSISITTTAEAEEAVAEMLGPLLACPTSSYFNFKTRVSVVSVICDGTPEKGIREKISAGLVRIKNCGLAIHPGKISITRIRREDWAESWKRHFKPIEIGAGLLVKPSWSKCRPRRNQTVVVLDPGLSFGTGQHPTTAFCLREIARRRKTGTRQSFLDIGTGSGILAIAAAKLGYRPVHAFDIDASAIRVARANARANHVQTKLTIGRSSVAELPIGPAQKYDLICANLISELLIAERRRIGAQLKSRGTLVLAGILNSEFRRVQAAFEGLGLKPLSGKTKKEWRSGSFRAGKNFLNSEVRSGV